MALALRDLEICQKEYQRYNYSAEEYRRYTDPAIFRLKVPLEIKLYYINSILYHLMMMWHKEVFQHFACNKRVFDTYWLFFQDDKKPNNFLSGMKTVSRFGIYKTFVHGCKEGLITIIFIIQSTLIT